MLKKSEESVPTYSILKKILFFLKKAFGKALAWIPVYMVKKFFFAKYNHLKKETYVEYSIIQLPYLKEPPLKHYFPRKPKVSKIEQVKNKKLKDRL